LIEGKGINLPVWVVIEILPVPRVGMINNKKYRHEDEKKAKEEKDSIPTPPSSSLNNNNNNNIGTTSSNINNINNNNNTLGDKDKGIVVRGGVIRNGIYYSETELAEQTNMAWCPCYWTRERINKWVEEVENPDTLKSLAKTIPSTPPL